MILVLKSIITMHTRMMLFGVKMSIYLVSMENWFMHLLLPLILIYLVS